MKTFEDVFPKINQRLKIPDISADIITDKVVYKDDTHTYMNKDGGWLYTSVTTFIKSFKPYINYSTKRTEKLYDWDEKRVKEFWKAKGDYAINRGNFLHTLLEMYCLDRNIDFDKYLGEENNYDEMRLYCKLLKENLHDIEVLIPEMVLEDSKYRIAGRPDIIAKDKGKVYILDLKTNLKNLHDYCGDETYMSPFDMIPTCKLGDYILQLNVYRYLYEKTYKEEINSMFILHAFDGELNIIEIEKLPDNVIEQALNVHYNKRNCNDAEINP